MNKADYDIEQIRDIARELAHQIDWLSRTSRLGGCLDWHYAQRPYVKLMDALHIEWAGIPVRKRIQDKRGAWR